MAAPTTLTEALRRAARGDIETVVPDEHYTTTVLELVERERAHQRQTWGKQDHDPLFWLSLIAEELGEANRAIQENLRDGLDKDTALDNYINELSQVAALAVAAIERELRREASQ